MNILECEMLDLLKKLNHEFGAIAIKSEFEAEGSTIEEILRLNEFVYKSGLVSYIKIGGCEAVNDLNFCKRIDAAGIIVPMVETKFAMTKFIDAVNVVFSKDDISNLNLIVNAETITCLENLKHILTINGIKIIKSVTVGRSDLSKSMGIDNSLIEEDIMFSKVKNILDIVNNYGFKAGIGGTISLNSINFINKLLNLINNFETRKVVFATDSIKNLDKSIIAAINFEILYIKNKCNNYKQILQQDTKRLKQLENRINLL